MLSSRGARILTFSLNVALLCLALNFLLSHLNHSLIHTKRDLIASLPGHGETIVQAFGNFTVSKLAIPFGILSSPTTRNSLFSKRLRHNEHVSDEIWAKAISDGESLRCVMRMTAEELDAIPLANFPRWPANPSRQATSQSILSMGGEDDVREWKYYEAKHDDVWSANGRSGRGTGAEYITYFSTRARDPIIIAELMFSPAQRTGGQHGAVLPDLKQWSDVVFMQYYSAIQSGQINSLQNIKPDGTSQIPCPKYIFIPVIKTDTTIEIFDATAEKAGVSGAGKVVPGNIGKAVLGTAHGRAVAYFLATHKRQFGLMEIKNILLYMGDYKIPYAVFELGPVSRTSKARL
ncbi:hypothetical protein EJ08DRAFT_698491 [Tothia fuscella]|uniref:Uncharacterized protein n=1 Tax=Tothia fuscella TaxID=1048955 RepID=A0A9P4NNX7_9PEZI|nr:hypothetical protein EJ08DRAFT_698491 [Tothia fuscella]